MTVNGRTNNEQLLFLGGTTASISHELKNVLAIIKENNGLIDDYLIMSEKGVPFEPERLKTALIRIEQQIQRADGVIKALNQLAHTVDDTEKTVDLNEILHLLSTISARSASMHRVNLELRPGQMPRMVTTCPLLLLTFLGACLSFAVEGTAAGSSVIMSVLPEPSCGLSFESLESNNESPEKQFPFENFNTMMDTLGVHCSQGGKAGRIHIIFNRN